jgi:hypothetical protein
MFQRRGARAAVEEKFHLTAPMASIDEWRAIRNPARERQPISPINLLRVHKGANAFNLRNRNVPKRLVNDRGVDQGYFYKRER